MVQNNLNRRQSKKVVSLLEKNPPRSLAGQVILVDMLQRSGETERAREALRRAVVLLGFERFDHPDRDRII
ncbi:MAG: hypothetical protein GY869_26000 [Planctomycetes bacterium]|nr:hypothetical protein [Planctomycetota bacterium]